MMWSNLRREGKDKRREMEEKMDPRIYLSRVAHGPYWSVSVSVAVCIVRSGEP